jgi:iron complex outermembrane recepter protein
MTKYYTSIALMLAFWQISAQDCQLQFSGKIKDLHNNEGLKKSSISLKNAQHNYHANNQNDGTFLIKNICPGWYDVEVLHGKCEPSHQRLFIDKNMHQDFTLEHHMALIKEVLIKAPTKVNQGSISQKINQEDIDRNMGQNLGNIIEQLSGVSTLKSGNNIAKPIIHGMLGSRVGMMANGVKMADQEWGVEHAPNLDPNAYQKISVIKGAASLKYGADAIGGMVLLEKLKPKAIDSLYGKINSQYLSNGKGGIVNIDLTKSWANHWSVSAQGSYKKLGDLQTPHYSLQNTGAEENAMGLNLDYYSFEKGLSLSYNISQQNFGIFKGSHLGNIEDLYQAIQYQNPAYINQFGYEIGNPKQNIKHQTLRLESFYRFEDYGKLSFLYSYQNNQRLEYDLRRGDLAKLPATNLKLDTHQLKLDHSLERPDWALETGLAAAYQINFPDPSTQTKRIIPDYRKLDLGAYALYKYKFSKSFNVEAAARYDLQQLLAYKWYSQKTWDEQYQAQFGQFLRIIDGNSVFAKPYFAFQNASFNVGLQYQYSPALELKLNLAKLNRSPNPAELFADGLHHSASRIEYGNLGLKPENMYQINLGIKGKLAYLQGFEYEINPYFSYAKNYINDVPLGLERSIRGMFPVWGYQAIRAQIYGLDLDWQLQAIKSLKLQGKYAYVKGQDLSQQQPLILMPPLKINHVLSYNNPKYWDFSFRLEHQFVAQQSRYPDYNFNIDIIQNNQLESRLLDISTPPPAYQLWHTWLSIEPWAHVELSLGVNNLTNRVYRDYLNRMRYYANDMGRSFMVGMKYNF